MVSIPSTSSHPLFDGLVARVSRRRLQLAQATNSHQDDSLPLASHPLEAQELITLVGNLLDNALDAAAQGPESDRWVRISLRRENSELVVRVHGSGPGVDAAIVEQMFHEGFTTKQRRSRRSRGLGLALVQQVVRRHRGEVSVRNEGGAVVTVRLPLESAAGKR
jgi:sensor histidine kinase regulating citrate/malate metabolism